MKSLKQDASYIEKMTVQDTNETDWLGFNGTTLTYKPEDILVNAGSTATSLKYGNTDATDKNVVLVASDGTTDSLHELYIDGNNVVYNELDLANMTETNQLTASDAQSSDNYGSSVAITSDGLVAMIGAHKEDTVATDAGKVYTYKRTTKDDAWAEVSQLTASDAQSQDFFGASVTITGDGLVAMVGAHWEDTANSNAGKVYTYKRATIDDAWSEVSQLTASDAQSDEYFGTSVVITGDGLVAMVGTHETGTATGKVYTYKRTTIDDAWTEVNQLTASDGQGDDEFGKSVAITSDGLIAMVGAYKEDTSGTEAGKVYTYKRATIDDAWSEVNMLTASDAQSDDYFGSGVAITSDGLVAMVGAFKEDTTASNAGKVYTYKRATIDDTWSEVSQLTASDAQSDDNFGSDVAITPDGAVLMVGASQLNNSVGKVYTYNIPNLYTLDITDANLPSAPTYGYIESDVLLSITAEDVPEHMLTLPYERATVSATDVTNKTITIDKLVFKDAKIVINNESYVVSSVVDNGDNTYTATINNFNFTSTIKYVYVQGNLSLPVTSSTTTTVVSDKTAKVIAIDDTIYVDGTEVVVNDVVTGDITMDIQEVNQLTASDAAANNYFGRGTAVSADGLVAMVGSVGVNSYAGKVYTYKRATIDYAWTEVSQLTASDASGGDHFGQRLTITSDGLVAMVGAFNKDTSASSAGKVYTYKRAAIDDAWTEISQLTASDAEASDDFGSSVAITTDGLVAMVGAYKEDTAGSSAGKVYTYKRAAIDDAWTEVSQLTASDAEANDQFGISAAMTGDGLVAMVGAFTEDTAASNAGKVYTYKRATVDDVWTEVNQLTASDAQSEDNFGVSVAITSDGLVAMVGAHGEDTAASDAGKVYFYKRTTIDDAWTEVNQLTASDAQSSDQFGEQANISEDGSVLIIGAWNANSGAGKVYTYNTNLQKDITLTIPEQPSAPATAIVLDKSVLIPVSTTSFTSGNLNLTYRDHTKQSRAVQRKITATEPNTLVTSNLVTNLTRLR